MTRRITLDCFPELRKLKDNRTFRALKFIDPNGFFDLIHPGNSFVIKPANYDGCVIKVLNESAQGQDCTCIEEHKLIDSLGNANRKNFTFPEALASATSPDFVVMTNTGTALGSSLKLLDYYIKGGFKLGSIIGAFQSMVYNKTGKIHADPHPGNITIDINKQLGFVDIASVRYKVPERMVFPALYYNPEIALGICTTFNQSTGIQFSSYFIRERAHEYFRQSRFRSTPGQPFEEAKRSYQAFEKMTKSFPRVFIPQ